MYTKHGKQNDHDSNHSKEIKIAAKILFGD
ncbi:Uncharacterised protein [Yersinia enterocolitica]|nr:Uncharacterised protein [Yersinia enterocolitica]